MLEHNWQIEPFSGSKHDCSGFSCGEQALDDYIKKYASQDLKRNIARVFVALTPADMSILGYYTLSAASVKKKDIPPAVAKKLPHYPVPAVLIGRLAVDKRVQGKGLGRHLLVDAFYRVLTAKNTVGINSVIVDAKNTAARSFYKQYGFMEFSGDPNRLFIPMATVEKIYQ